MGDNTTLDAGTGGDVIATDEIAGVKHQRVKVEFGADGSATDASSANPFPVVQTGALPAGSAAIGKLAANSGVDIGDVDVTSSALPTGAATSAKQPALGTAGVASTDVITIQGIASGTVVPVSGTVTANLGTAAVTNAGTFAVQIAANSSVNQAQVSGTVTSVNSGTKDAGTQRVILASDQTVVPISDNSGSLTVDAPVGTPAFVRLSDGSAAITTLPVSLATLPALTAGSAAIGKLAANSGVDIGDVDVTSLPATPAGTNLIGFVTVTPSATGGWSKIKYAAQTTTVVKPKGTAGTFGGYYAYNPNATVAYIQVFDLATATTVTLGTTVPDMIFAIPAGSAANLEITNGVNMALGMQLACTTTALGSTAPGTGLDLTVLFK